MLTTLAIAFVLGCFAGLAPGPYTTMVVATAVERGFRPALRLAFTPLVTDVAPLIVTVLVLERLSPRVMNGIGAIGGVIVIVIGIRLLQRHSGAGGDTLDPADAAPPTVRFWHVAAGTLFSPAPWLFWLLVGSPLFLRAWNRDPLQGAVFVTLLFATNISTATSLAWGASHGARLLSVIWRQRVLTLAGAALILAGLLLCWNALFGDPQTLIDSQQGLRDLVEESTGTL